MPIYLCLGIENTLSLKNENKNKRASMSNILIPIKGIGILKGKNDNGKTVAMILFIKIQPTDIFHAFSPYIFFLYVRYFSFKYFII